MSCEPGSSAERWSSPGRAVKDKTKKANELVGALVAQITKEGDIVVAIDSKSKLWRDLSLKRATQKLEHEICRHCEESRVIVWECSPAVNDKSAEDQRDWRSCTNGEEDRDGCPEKQNWAKKSEMGDPTFGHIGGWTIGEDHRDE